MRILSLNSRGVASASKQSWIKELRLSNKVNFIGIQESYVKCADQNLIAAFWGKGSYDFDIVEARGRSGGIVSVWDTSCFSKLGKVAGEGFLAVWGKWCGISATCGFINIYAPQDLTKKKSLWNCVSNLLKDHSDFIWTVFGDFNEVRYSNERRGTIFSPRGAESFNDFIHEAGLAEVKSGGLKFTRMSADGSKLSKLDRFFVTPNMFSQWPNPNVLILPKLHSDHSPLLFRGSSLDFGPTYFKFFNSWLGDPALSSLVATNWPRNFNHRNLSPIRLFMEKLKRLKSKIKSWRAEVNLAKRGRLEALKGDIEAVERKAEIAPLSPSDLSRRQECLVEIKDIEKAYSLDLRQRARLKWAVEGDENSRFFHGLINSNRRNNFLHGLSVNGLWVSDPGAIKQEAVDFFEKKFSGSIDARPAFRSNNFLKLSPEQATFLESPFTESEIKSAVWDCGSDKAPGPDGFSFAFFKRYWNYIKGDLFAAVKHFEEAAYFDPGCNSSFIALIPKVDSPLSLKEYRPISLLGSLYKIIAKTLANRLKQVISTIIGPEQTAFIHGRCILDGPIIASEVLSWAKKKKKKLFLFKVDFNKAFDSVHWDFLDDTLTQMHFGLKWRKWIHGCLSSASVSVLLNGSPTGEFLMKKGLRQGDPLAPYLFIIVAEALNVALKKAANIGILHGVKLPNSGPSISILQYADDALFLGEWSRTNLANLIRILRCFYLSSGLKINLSKSSLLGVGVDDETVRSMARGLHCIPGSFPINYLGLQVGGSMNKCEAWAPIINKFSARLSKWKSKSLSYGGRLVLVKSVLGNLGTYFFSLYRVPSKILKKLESLRLNFFWGSKDGTRKIPWISWSMVRSDKDKGGLGVGSLKAMNLALLSKWWWRFKTERDSLWKKVVQSVHGDYGGLNKSLPKGSFPGIWNNILKINKDFDSVNIPLPSWFQEHPLPDSEGSVIKWAIDRNGTFSVSSLRKAFDDFFLAIRSSIPFSWNNWVPPSVNILAWRFLHKRLPTKVNLAKRGVALVSTLCPFCNSVDETEAHLFKECRFANRILREILVWWGFEEALVNEGTSILKWDANLNLHGDKGKAFKGIILTYIWAIWHYRNGKIFDSSQCNHEDLIISHIQAQSFFWLKQRSKLSNFKFKWIEWCSSPLSCL